MSSTLYAGGRSNESPSLEVGLDGASLMLALLALNTADSCEMFVVRIVRDRFGPWAGAGKTMSSRSLDV